MASRTEPLLTLNEFSLALTALKYEDGPKRITVPMVHFAYLCHDMYKLVKASYFQVFQALKVSPDHVKPLLQVFAVLDLVANNDFADSDEKERKACAAFAACDNVAVLNYLWCKGFFWDETTLLSAVKYKSFECFKFALQKDCPLSLLSFRDFSELVSLYGSRDMLFYLTEKQ